MVPPPAASPSCRYCLVQSDLILIELQLPPTGARDYPMPGCGNRWPPLTTAINAEQLLKGLGRGTGDGAPRYVKGDEQKCLCSLSVGHDNSFHL